MASKKKYDKEKAKVWGSADYLKARFDDVQDVAEMTRKCKAVKAVKAAVKAVSTDRDRLAARRVYRTTWCVPGEEPHDGVIACISFGLNGGGSQADYLEALRNLVKGGGFRIFDCVIDAIDDVASVLCTVDASRLAPAEGAEVRIGAGCKSGKPVKPVKPAPGKGKADA